MATTVRIDALEKRFGSLRAVAGVHVGPSPAGIEAVGPDHQVRAAVPVEVGG